MDLVVVAEVADLVVAAEVASNTTMHLQRIAHDGGNLTGRSTRRHTIAGFDGQHRQREMNLGDGPTPLAFFFRSQIFLFPIRPHSPILVR